MLRDFIRKNFINSSNNPLIRKSSVTLKRWDKSARSFLFKYFVNSHYPLIMNLYFRTKTRSLKSKQAHNSLLSYAEIEASLSRRYEATFRRKINWDNPQTYTEKMQVAKLYMPSGIKTKLADKYLVRDWIAGKVGKQYLIPLLGVYDSFDEINFDVLPEKFVIKCTHDSGSYMLVNDKNKIDKEFMRRKYEFHMTKNLALTSFQMHYGNIKPRIITEQCVGDAVNDYKFFCFNGKPYFCTVEMDRFINHTRNFYNLQWKRIPLSLGYPNNSHDVERPEGFNEMKEIAEELSRGFSQVRVDFYFVEGRVYCGEMTFTHANGFQRFTPDEWDYKLGFLWPLDNSIRRKILASNNKFPLQNSTEGRINSLSELPKE